MTKHTNCTSCGVKFSFFGRADAGNGLCQPCDSERYMAAKAELSPETKAMLEAQQAEKARLARIIVSTETTFPGVGERLGIVSADVAFGQGPLKDLAVGMRDLVGGRSATMGKVMRESREEALEELRREAHGLGADAVIAVSFTVSAVGHSNMVLLSAVGTAVKLV